MKNIQILISDYLDTSNYNQYSYQQLKKSHQVSSENVQIDKNGIGHSNNKYPKSHNKSV